MKLRGIVWTGIQTERFDEMAAFMRALTGERPNIEERAFDLWAFPDGDLFEVRDRVDPGRERRAREQQERANAQSTAA